MLVDYVHIRKGTDPKTAFRKSMKIIWDYILLNSKGLKTEKTIKIRIQ